MCVGSTLTKDACSLTRMQTPSANLNHMCLLLLRLHRDRLFSRLCQIFLDRLNGGSEKRHDTPVKVKIFASFFSLLLFFRLYDLEKSLRPVESLIIVKSYLDADEHTSFSRSCQFIYLLIRVSFTTFSFFCVVFSASSCSLVVLTRDERLL